VAVALLESMDRPLGVRLLGVSLSGLGRADGGMQLTFELEAEAPADRAPDRASDPARMPTDVEADHLQRSWQAVAVAVDTIRARYGGASVGPASLVTGDGLALRRRGDAPWGPNAPAGPERGAR
jgi:hypothetical protein